MLNNNEILQQRRNAGGGSYRRRSVTASSRRATCARKGLINPFECPTGGHLPAPSSNCVSFTAPSSIPNDFLTNICVRALIKHILYARGLLPMTVDNLLVDNDATKRFQSPVETPKIPYQFSKSSSLRQQRNSRNQIHRLLSEWILMGTFLKCFETQPNSGETTIPDLPKLAFILISIGPSFTRCHELYLVDVQKMGAEDEISKRNESNNIFNQERRRQMEVTLTQRLLATLLNHGESPLQELPAPTSSSFRLWVTIGVWDAFTYKEENRLLSPFPTTSQRMNEFWKLLHSSSTHERVQTESFAPLIERRGVPMVRQSPSSSTRPRRRKQNHHICIQLRRSTENTRNRVDDHLHCTSERLSWFSLPTSVKGFR
jgi:hypothetical protein